MLTDRQRPTTATTTTGDRLSSIGRAALGRPADWHLVRPPSPRLPHPGLHWVGPLVVLASVLGTWSAFAGAQGEEGNAALALYLGSVSIATMAWSFVLALRLRWLERWFGGLDRMYRLHRWLGATAVVAMFLHIETIDSLRNGIPGVRDLADSGQELAGVAEVLLYVLVGLSILRFIPTRYWRLTHKLLVVPYVFACFHFFTAEKPYANGSGWGWWFGVVMAVGLAAGLARLVVRDMVLRGVRYRVATIVHTPSTTELALEPVGRRRLHQRIGQFAYLKVQAPGLSEPHPFTIASGPDESTLRFFIRDLGDWTRRMRIALAPGTEVLVEGPYGRFVPLTRTRRPTVWVAGGVGITPFLAAACTRDPHDGPVPHLFYAIRSESDASAMELLRSAEQAGRVKLHFHSSADGTRMTESTLIDQFGAGGLKGAYVAMCGPTPLVRTMSAAAHRAGARSVHREAFDMRSGFGGDPSRELDVLIEELSARRTTPSTQ
ncbi:MAG: ferric reductase-like transmembrane domain-containing protein [Actinomycetota bacterium]|nr:ferric reductase-like transmembrane domain-containing protein [Actinomycetota bacterium]